MIFSKYVGVIITCLVETAHNLVHWDADAVRSEFAM